MIYQLDDGRIVGCGYRVGRETFQENTFNYCPNCGARMKGGVE